MNDVLPPAPIRSDDLSRLGTVLTVWAHPDDEAYLAGGLLAGLTDAGMRAVCVTATRGESADPAASAGERAALAAVRTRELAEALAVLGVTEHHWLGLPDGGCADVDSEVPLACLLHLLDETRPDTVLTFGPDGFTGHPDHRAVSRWVELALERSAASPALLHAVLPEEVVERDRALVEEFGVYELGRPRVCAPAELAVRLPLNGDLLDRKVEALLRQESQTSGLVAAIGLDRFREWVALEAFAPPAGT
jgi:LmbE family N-acetylglucosaminyl deacetylase